MKKIVIISLILTAHLSSNGQTVGAGVADIDGNNYSTVILGDLEWMSENLRTTRYSNGDLIPFTMDPATWLTYTTGASTHYDDVSLPYFGKLYNWYVVGDSRNVCPTGWHVPDSVEWSTMIDLFGGLTVAGGKLKSTGTWQTSTGLWSDPNLGATNESGFNGLPGGIRSANDGFSLSVQIDGFYWSSSDVLTNFAWEQRLTNSETSVTSIGLGKNYGMSIRCAKPSSVETIELNPLNKKELIQLLDVMGRTTEFRPNTLLIYVYSDGTTERVFKME